MTDLKKQENFWYWPLDVLTESLSMRQENLLRREIPSVSTFFAQSTSSEELAALYPVWLDIAARIEKSLLQDSGQLFPYAKSLVNCHHHNATLDIPVFSSLHQVHLQQEQAWSKIIGVLKDFIKVVGNGSAKEDTYRYTLKLEIEDLFLSLTDLSNTKFSIYFPRLLELENTVARASALSGSRV